MWQQNYQSSKNMMMSGLPYHSTSTSNKNNNTLNVNLHQPQTTASSMGYFNSLKDQHNINNASSSNLNLLALGQSTQNLTANEQQLNSTSVTPFLKPTVRNHEIGHYSNHNHSQQGLSSPFMKAAFQPNGHVLQNLNFASMVAGPHQNNQGQISPLNNSNPMKPQQQ